MRTCNNCGKKIPLGKRHVRVTAIGFDCENAEFCRPECFEEYYAKRRYVLQSEEKAIKTRGDCNR